MSSGLTPEGFKPKKMMIAHKFFLREIKNCHSKYSSNSFSWLVTGCRSISHEKNNKMIYGIGSASYQLSSLWQHLAPQCFFQAARSPLYDGVLHLTFAFRSLASWSEGARVQVSVFPVGSAFRHLVYSMVYSGTSNQSYHCNQCKHQELWNPQQQYLFSLKRGSEYSRRKYVPDSCTRKEDLVGCFGCSW